MVPNFPVTSYFPFCTVTLAFHQSTLFLSCICVGPVLRAEAGDTLRVTFMNKADRSYSIQPHGLHYDKHFQGSSYDDGKEALVVMISFNCKISDLSEDSLNCIP